MSYETILYEKQERLTTITLNRPDKLNNIRPPMPEELEKAIAEANADPDVRVIILQGAGKAFCAGFDFSEDLACFKKLGGQEGSEVWDPGRDMIMVSEKKLGKDFFLRYAKRIAYTHHERWDGKGYPQGLQGEDIPVSGRLMAIADVYDALVSKRVYKPPLPHSQAASFILKGRGSQFDPDMVDAFENLTENFRQIALEYTDYEEERLTLTQ